MSKKEKKVIPYADASYYKEMYGADVKPVSNKTKISKELRSLGTAVSVHWNLAAKDVWVSETAEGRTVFAALFAKRDVSDSRLLSLLSSYTGEHKLDIVEIVSLPGGEGLADAEELGAIVKTKIAK